MSKTVFKNTLFYTLVDYLPLIASFLLLPIYTKYLSPEDYGYAALIQVFTSILSICLGLQLNGAVNRFLVDYQDNAEEQKRYVTSNFIFISAILTIVSLIFNLFGTHLMGIIFPNSKLPYAPYFQLTLLTVDISILTSIFSAIIRYEERGLAFLKLNVVGSAIGIAFYYYQVVILKNGILGIVYSNLFSAAVIFVAYLLLMLRYFVPYFRMSYIWPSLRYGLPLIPHAISGFIFMYSDRIILEKFVPIAAIGIYALSDKLASVIKTLVESMNTSYTPSMLKQLSQNKEAGLKTFSTLITQITAIVYLLSAGLILLAPEVVSIFTNPRYHEAIIFLPILVLGYVFRMFYGFTGLTIIFTKKMQYFPLITLVAGLANLSLNLWLCPRFGVIVAAYTTLASYALQAGGAYLFSRKHFPLQFEPRKLALLTLGFVAIVTLSLFSRGESHGTALIYNIAWKSTIMGLLLLLYSVTLGVSPVALLRRRLTRATAA